MTSVSTREFMALHAIATHFGRPVVPTDQAPIESFLCHLKTEAPQLAAIEEPAALATELDTIRAHYNGRAPARRHRLRHARGRARRLRLSDPRDPRRHGLARHQNEQRERVER